MALIQHRRGTAAQAAAANIVLAAGELGHELDTNRQKIGDGVTAWNDLPYIQTTGPAGADGADAVTPTVFQTSTQPTALALGDLWIDTSGSY
jgi:hypothetical protein